MLYHSFKTDSEPKIIGVKDGMSQVEIRPEGFANNTAYQEIESFFAHDTYWSKSNHVPPYPFVIEYAKLRSKAKLTDFLEFSPFFMACPFMVSRRAKVVLSNYYINPIFFFDVRIFDKGDLVTEDYCLVYCPYLNYDAIDFAKSKFRVNLGLPSMPKWEYHNFSNLEYYQIFKTLNRKSIELESMIMSDKFDSNLDFFSCRIGPMYMSERLKLAIEEARLTGLFFPIETSSLAYAN